MITRVEIKNYRSIARADVTMGPLTVLVGRNGAGKSSFVDALKFVRDALQTGLENAVNLHGGFGSILRLGTPEDESLEIAVEIDRPKFRGRYEFALANGSQGLEVRREKGWCQRIGFFKTDVPNDNDIRESQFERVGKHWVTDIFVESSRRIMSDTLQSSLENDKLVLPTLNSIGYLADLWHSIDGDFYTQFSGIAREPQIIMNPHGLSDNGDNFLSVLRDLTKNESTKAEVINALSHVVRGVTDVRVDKLGSYIIGQLQHNDLEHSPWFDLEMESDGTVRMLFLLTALHQKFSPAARVLLAFEDPEFALHPGALAILADEIKAASHRRQILITTQSPDLIARFPADDLRIVERRAGLTHIAPLEEEQRQVIEAQLFDAGELLRSEGLRGAGEN